MAFDLVGINPKEPIGHCYRLNVWKWHELWNFLKYYCNNTVSNVTYWYTNDGEIVCKETCEEILKKLKQPEMITYFNKYLNEREKKEYMSLSTYRPLCSQDIESFCLFLSKCDGFEIR